MMKRLVDNHLIVILLKLSILNSVLIQIMEKFVIFDKKTGINWSDSSGTIWKTLSTENIIALDFHT